jgi:hypothetical protein
MKRAGWYRTGSQQQDQPAGTQPSVSHKMLCETALDAVNRGYVDAHP